jgi:adenylate cyclase
VADEDRSGFRLPRELTGQLPTFLRDLLRPTPPAPEGLADLSDDERDVAAALIELGIPEPEAAAAVREGRVPLVIAQHRRRDKTSYTLEEISERSGVPAQVLTDVLVAMGLPVPERFGKRDLHWARQARRFLDVMPVKALIRSARARGIALSAVARSDLAVIRDELMLPMRQAGADDLTMAVALAEAAEALEDLAADALVHTYEMAMDHQLSSELVALAARTHSEQVHIAVGFVDVEGYTALSSRVDPSGLDAMIDAFEHRVLDVVRTAPGVSPVKYLGDAVMLVAAHPSELADVMVTLTTPVEELADSPLRGGMAVGPVLFREGDYYGSPVNLAARLTDLARTWSLLAAEDLHDTLAEHFEVSALRPTRIRGIGTSRPVAVRGRRGAA